jgi:hypothetical protein
MQTENLISSKRDDTTAEPTELLERSVPHTDVEFFTSALLAQVSAPMRSETSSLLTNASDLLSQSTDRMTKSLRALSKKNNERVMQDYPSQLSNTLLLTHVLIKGVAKTAQGIEKISNLQ